MTTAAGVLGVLLVAAAPEVADRAAAAYEGKRWAEAAELFAEAYDEEPDPKYIYAAAQASRLAKDCAAAVPRYRTFLEVNDLPAAEADARENLEQCEAELDDEAATTTTTVGGDQADVLPILPQKIEDKDEDRIENTIGQPIEQPVEQPPPRRRWYADPLGGVLLATGVVGLAVGGGLYGQARADERTAEESGREPIYEERINRAATLSRVAIGLFAVGGAALLGATTRYAVVGTRDKRRRVAFGPRGLRF